MRFTVEVSKAWALTRVEGGGKKKYIYISIICPYMHILYLYIYVYTHMHAHFHICTCAYITFCLLMEGGMVRVYRILRVMPQPAINIAKICFVTNYDKLRNYNSLNNYIFTTS